SVEYLTKHFIHEITIGIDDTDTRAGLITTGASRAGRMTELDTRIHRAAARAALITGAPILTQPAIDATTTIAIFNEEGLPLHRVLFAPTDNNARNTWIAEQGGRIGFNTHSYEPPVEDPPLCTRPPNERLEHLFQFIRAGHLDKALTSTHAKHSLLDGPGLNGHTVNHIFTDLIPDLRNAGLDEATITGLFIDNPADFLAIRN
ncbi:MAG: phosphotriesterase, partial [Mycobacterium sp.]|nr:phosphotriesterase [Mycobacterium sp.]